MNLELPTEDLARYVITLAYECPNDQLDIPSVVLEDWTFSESPVETLVSGVEHVEVVDDTMIVVIGEITVGEQVGRLPALSGRSKFDPPRAPPEPIIEERLVEYEAKIDLTHPFGCESDGIVMEAY